MALSAKISFLESTNKLFESKLSSVTQTNEVMKAATRLPPPAPMNMKTVHIEGIERGSSIAVLVNTNEANDSALVGIKKLGLFQIIKVREFILLRKKLIEMKLLNINVYFILFIE